MYDLALFVAWLGTCISVVIQRFRYLPHFPKLRLLTVRKINPRGVTIWFHPLPARRHMCRPYTYCLPLVRELEMPHLADQARVTFPG